jgi:transposase
LAGRAKRGEGIGIFGSSSERSSKIFPQTNTSGDSASDRDPPEQSTGEESSAQPDSDANPADAAPNSADAASNASADGKRRPRRPGHGRLPACAYTGCQRVLVTHGSLRPGDACRCCGQGTVYRQSNWSPVVRLKGQAPVGGTVYELEQLRCGLCGKVYGAELPEEAGPEKYDPSVASTIATFRYGEGMPWNRIQRMQRSAGVPLPASTQWEIVRDAIPGGIQAAHDHLLDLAAQGDLVHNDDTRMCVLELSDKLKHQQPLRDDAPERRGVFTTNVLSRSEERPPIALFFTGPRHAGENLRDVLARRRPESPPPLHMSDGLSRNIPGELQVILANCLTHGRRKFVDVIDVFPAPVKYVVDCLKKVYRTDAQAAEQHLSPAERLRLHQQESKPVMDELHRWLQQQFDEKRVEPNSSLGNAINYLLKRWDKLTLFLRVPGAPLDNNLCEQALKMAIRHRKNSLFYKTMRGAEVGDLYMSIIHTCYLCGADPLDYLTALQRCTARVVAAVGAWMPWNYRDQIAAAEAASGRDPPREPGARTTSHPAR